MPEVWETLILLSFHGRYQSAGEECLACLQTLLQIVLD